ncbi:ferredoxin--NADP reductase [Neolewinella persica]|uniref:ferredoxin--NADP reductase n=1 Tax=Neolewinella persica TaxID=70998 RepID=UPI00037CDA19|nr:ferredoxin--NADP reductase [Neolewinella persica]
MKNIIQFHQLKIVAVQYETDTAVRLGFHIPESKKGDFQFEPGQYLTISLTINGKKVRRAYSICSPTHQSVISVLVKRLDNGLVSNYLNDRARVGDSIDVLPPSGRFKLTLNKNAEHHYYFFGAGSGITPLISMIASLLESEPHTHCYLLYGNRDEDCILFRKKLERLQLVYKNRFVLKHILSRPKKVRPNGTFGFLRPPKVEWQGEIGRIDKKRISDSLQDENFKTLKIDGYYICGPGPMIEATFDGLTDLKIEKDLIHREYFSAPVADISDVDSVSSGGAQVTSNVKVILDGKKIDLTITDDTNIVQALLRKDIEPPYSCLSGTCSTCMAKLEKGEVVMDVSIGLEEDEKERGFVLTCQSHPLTEEVTINYDKGL